VKSRSGTRALAQRLGVDYVGADVSLTGVSLSAGEVEPGDLFVAVAGARYHGIDFAAEAIQRGAVAVLTDSAEELEIPVLVHPSPKTILGEVCEDILGPVDLQLFGVTGTNGKTSVTTYLRELLTAQGVKTALSSSVGFSTPSDHFPSSLTTPELTTLRKYLHRFANEGGQAAAIEVSAQALTRHRVDGLKFDVVGFTNLSRDHMDDYGDMGTYFAAKAELFTAERANHGVVFLGDDYARQLAANASIPVTTIGPDGDVQYEFQARALRLTGALNLELDFPSGELMARNFAVAAVMLHVAGYKLTRLSSAAGFQVPGRLELVSEARPHVYVDYAHTPDGIAAAVAEIASRYPGVSLVFGASGNRDQGKRFEMGAAAASASRVYLTDQHPRDEDPAEIRRAVAKGIESQNKEFIEVSNPAEAVAAAIAGTPRDEAVLWCGPGHLKYREIAGQKVPFDAREIAKSLVEKC
jgi:UDP-N-acetylmuramoyl-L-alanyl-D-glutamate--2,6-diaminopimelate ligase